MLYSRIKLCSLLCSTLPLYVYAFDPEASYNTSLNSDVTHPESLSFLIVRFHQDLSRMQQKTDELDEQYRSNFRQLSLSRQEKIKFKKKLLEQKDQLTELTLSVYELENAFISQQIKQVHTCYADDIPTYHAAQAQSKEIGILSKQYIQGFRQNKTPLSFD